MKTWTLRTLDAAAPSLRMRAQLTIASPACLSVARVLNRESKSEGGSEARGKTRYSKNSFQDTVGLPSFLISFRLREGLSAIQRRPLGKCNIPYLLNTYVLGSRYKNDQSMPIE